ncbi:MAG: glycosyltransferase family 39 protein [Candidatus Hydrogenedentes bacterium]|nr:glycosyltransferase family 39 protein [Candidatus Hydrogenedentota bacterium]
MGRHLVETRWAAVAIVVIVVAGAVLRALFLGVCLTNDETITYDWSSGSLRGAVQSQYYPLANVLAWCALQISHAEPVMRLPAFLAGVFSILAIYWLGKNVFSAPAGLVCAALLAVSTFHIQHSDNARYYSYVMLAVILSMLAIERYTSTVKVRWLPGWSAGVALGELSHPFFLLGAAGLSIGAGLWHLVTPRLKGIPRRALYLGLFCVLTAAGLAPILAYMAPKLLPAAEIAARAAGPGAAKTSYTHIRTGPSGFRPSSPC